MAAHADHQTSEPASGAALLPIFAIAVVVATIAICVVVAAPSTIALIVALLSRLIGPEEH